MEYLDKWSYLLWECPKYLADTVVVTLRRGIPLGDAAINNDSLPFSFVNLPWLKAGVQTKTGF